MSLHYLTSQLSLAVFSKKDFAGLKDIGRGGKQDDVSSTGMFGQCPCLPLSRVLLMVLPILVNIEQSSALRP